MRTTRRGAIQLYLNLTKHPTMATLDTHQELQDGAAESEIVIFFGLIDDNVQSVGAKNDCGSRSC